MRCKALTDGTVVRPATPSCRSTLQVAWGGIGWRILHSGVVLHHVTFHPGPCCRLPPKDAQCVEISVVAAQVCGAEVAEAAQQGDYSYG